MNNQYVLAMYDVRSKQNFIYKSTKCKEIIGASHIIEDVFKDYLYPAAIRYRNQLMGLPDKNDVLEAIYQYSTDEKFSVEKFKQRIKDGYLGEVVYEGGGNFFVLYNDKDTCIGINRIFSRDLLASVDTLRVLCTWIGDLDFNAYKKDRERIYALHRIDEAHESETGSINTLPFVQVAPDSGRPYTGGVIKVRNVENGIPAPEKVTTEQKEKYVKYYEYIEQLKGTESYDKEGFILDELVTERGKESLLAVAHIDVNGMGAALQRCLNGKTSYEECVDALREFSNGIKKDLVDTRIKTIDAALEKKYPDRKKIRRTIVAAGDDLTIICNANDVLDVIKAYFTNFPKDKNACAGIAIFHSHTPYSDAYSIAEECCKNAKRIVKNHAMEKNLMDFHYCQGGIDITLERMREKDTGGDMFSKPWLIDMVKEDNKTSLHLSPLFGDSEMDDKEKTYYKNGVMKMAEILNKIGRSNVKALAYATESGELETEMEIERITVHSNQSNSIKFDLGKQEPKNKNGFTQKRRKLIFDITTVYDLWFREG